MNISGVEWIIVLVAAFVLFGPKRLPELGRAIGKSIREFKKATTGLVEEEETTSKESAHR